MRVSGDASGPQNAVAAGVRVRHEGLELLGLEQLGSLLASAIALKGDADVLELGRGPVEGGPVQFGKPALADVEPDDGDVGWVVAGVFSEAGNGKQEIFVGISGVFFCDYAAFKSRFVVLLAS